MLSEYGFPKVNCSASGIFSRGYLQAELKYSLSAMLTHYVDATFTAWSAVIIVTVQQFHTMNLCTCVPGDAENVPPLTWLRYILNA
jgi:hypothetical protein